MHLPPVFPSNNKNKTGKEVEIMIKNMRCKACGRKRKPSHEHRAAGKTGKKYHPDCEEYPSTKKK